MNESKLSYNQLGAVRKYGTRPDGSPWNSSELRAMGASGYDIDYYTSAYRWDTQHPVLAFFVFFGVCCPIAFWLITLGIGVIAS